MATKYLLYQQTGNSTFYLDALNNIISGNILSVHTGFGTWFAVKWDDTGGNIDDINLAFENLGYQLKLNTEDELLCCGTTAQRPDPTSLPDGYPYLDTDLNIPLHVLSGDFYDAAGNLIGGSSGGIATASMNDGGDYTGTTDGNYSGFITSTSGSGFGGAITASFASGVCTGVVSVDDGGTDYAVDDTFECTFIGVSETTSAEFKVDTIS